MPRKATKRGAKKRVYKARPRKSIPTLMPAKFLNRMKYSESISLDPGAGSIDGYSFLANGIFDPNDTGTGHQAIGFDQLKAIYYDWQVLGAKCTCTFISQSNTASGQSFVGINLRNVPFAGTYSVDDMIEQTFCKSKLLGSYYSQPGTVVSKNFSAKKFSGTRFITAALDARGTDAADPIQPIYFEVWCGSIGGATDPALIYVKVRIEYVVLWSRLRTLDNS